VGSGLIRCPSPSINRPWSRQQVAEAPPGKLFFEEMKLRVLSPVNPAHGNLGGTAPTPVPGPFVSFFFPAFRKVGGTFGPCEAVL